MTGLDPEMDKLDERPPRFFDRDAEKVARDLLGDGLIKPFGPASSCGGMIVETEAYLSEGDDANHALQHQKTERNRAMFGPPGTLYVYQIYGMYHCLNVVCGPPGSPEAVLLRAIEPSQGRGRMKRRREEHRASAVPPDEIASGPGKLCMALDVDRSVNNMNVCEDAPLQVLEGQTIPEERVQTGPRVGVEYAERAADWPLRFRVEFR